MPVYIRKNVSYTPQSIDRMSDEEEDDYLQDPDQLIDHLPQPYRMINKVMVKLLEDVWNILETKENKRVTEERKIRPPKYDQPKKMQFLSQATALASSPDGRHLFAGLPNGLVALDAVSQQTLSQWEEDSSEITAIQVYSFTSTACLLITVDDMAVARLFLFTCDCLFFVKVMNESDGGAKLLVSRCEASLEGDYVGVVLENTGTKEVWFEAHKIPREAWVSEIEAIEAKFQKEKEQKEKEQKEREEREKELNQTEENVEEPAATVTPKQSLEEPEAKEQDSTDKGDSPRAPSPPPVAVDKNAHKFSPCVLTLRVRPPVPYAANASSSPFSAGQKVDGTGLVLGTGQTHIMSAGHLESRDSTFQHMHAPLVPFLTKDQDKKEVDVVTAAFHFLNPGRTLLTGLEPLGQTDRPTGVALWWKGTNHVLHFSLLKVSKGSDFPARSKSHLDSARSIKDSTQHSMHNNDTIPANPDVEHRPDVVWPFSSNISCTAVSPCTSHMAIGLDNGNVTIWDRYMGLQRGVVNMNPGSGVQMLRFVDPSLYPPAALDYPPYPQRSATYLLAQYRDSTQYLYDIGRATQDQAMCIGEKPERDDHVETLLDSIPDLPELSLVVQKDGTLYLKDIQTGVLVCQLALPNSLQIVSPWEPIIAFGGRGQLLYVKGKGEEGGETEDTTDATETTDTAETTVNADTTAPTETTVLAEPTDTAGVFTFTLRSYMTLDKYWNKRRTPAQLLVHPTVENRLDALMKERLAQQALRKQRLQMRWGMLRSDLAVIQSAKEIPINTGSRPFMTPSSGRSLPDDLLKSFQPHRRVSLGNVA